MSTGISLFFERGFTQRRVFDLCEGRTVIGSSEDCEITVPDVFVSRHHMELKLSDGVIQARDLRSKNGTEVNGVRLNNQWRTVEAGDLVTLAGRRVSVTLVTGHETVSLSADPVPSFTNGLLELDYENRTVLMRGRTLAARLSETQFNIFSCLWEHVGKNVRADRLKAQGWNDAITLAITDSALRTQISRIRSWISRCELDDIAITDVRGIGYRLEQADIVERDMPLTAPEVMLKRPVASL